MRIAELRGSSNAAQDLPAVAQPPTTAFGKALLRVVRMVYDSGCSSSQWQSAVLVPIDRSTQCLELTWHLAHPLIPLASGDKDGVNDFQVDVWSGAVGLSPAPSPYI